MNHDINKILSALYSEKNRRIVEKDFDWDCTARPEQKIPEGNWFGWMIMAGRGFGKTRTGAEAIKKLALSGEYKRICLIGETYDQARAIMVEGESGLMNIHSPKEMPIFKWGKKEIIWQNGTIAQLFSAENYEALRGPQFDLAWIDEFAKFENAHKVWEQLMFCLRLGNAPKVIITTTPRPKKILFDLTKRKDIHLTTGSTFDNAANLAQNFLNILSNEYGNTEIAKQEIEGKLLEENEYILWSNDNIQYSTPDLKTLDKIIIGVDPAISANSNSCETGIIVAGIKNGEFYIIDDLSGIMMPELWIDIVTSAYEKYKANEVIVETNQGGEILMAMLQQHSHIKWKSVKAKHSKLARAKPISILYKQKKVKHVRKFEALEVQMLNAHLTFANDRLDALVWALFELMSNPVPPPAAAESTWAVWG